MEAMARPAASRTGNTGREKARMHRIASSGCLLLVAGLAACEPRVPVSVEVSPATATADVTGATVQFTARVYDDRGELIPGTKARWWVYGDTVVATVSGSGLATVVGQGSTQIVAEYQAYSGLARLSVRLALAGLKTVSGDGQTGRALYPLPYPPTVFVHDASGAPIPDFEVAFEASDDGSALPPVVTTNKSGEAATAWVLGLPVGTQTLRATAGSHTVEFRATATEPPLTIPAAVLSRGRLTLPYREAIAARGGVGTLFWSLASGALPEGLALDSTGVIAGVPTRVDSTNFTVRVRDEDGNEASRRFWLRVCDAPLRIAPGEVVVDDPTVASWCPRFLPAGEEGDRYRVAVVRTDVVDDETRVSVVLKVNRADPEASLTLVDAQTPGARPVPRFPPALATGLRIADATSRFHARLLADAGRLIRVIGTGAVLPDRRADGNRSGPNVAMSKDPPPDRREFRPFVQYLDACVDPPPAKRPAYLVGFNDELAIYQDSVQQGVEPIRSADARQLLDYYEGYGAPTIAEYFGGVPDINGDERVNVFVSPVVPDWVAGFVWADDFLSAEECSWSNEMELVYFNRIMFDHLENAPDSGHYQALSTMVHEVKHVSSLYIRTRLGAHHPNWIEEGTAEIAAEISSRMAMEAAGGVARGARLDRDAYPTSEGVITTPENFGVLLRLARMTVSYSGELNSLNTNPMLQHTYYGTSWHFHRFLGDAYGNAAAKGDGAFFTALNDSSAPPGIAGIEAATGKRLPQHVEDYAVSMVLNGVGAPEPEPGFTTYDFPSAADFPPETFEVFDPELQPEGLYPWSHTGPEPVGFENAIYSGTLAPGGIRFHEFESDGRGAGIELEVSTGSRFDAVRVVIVRVR